MKTESKGCVRQCPLLLEGAESPVLGRGSWGGAAGEQLAGVVGVGGESEPPLHCWLPGRPGGGSPEARLWGARGLLRGPACP